MPGVMRITGAKHMLSIREKVKVCKYSRGYGWSFLIFGVQLSKS